MNNIPIKIGFALSAVGTFGLALIGYQAGMTATPNYHQIHGIFGGIHCSLLLKASLVMLFGYKITDEEAAMYARENAARLAAAAEAPKA